MMNPAGIGGDLGGPRGGGEGGSLAGFARPENSTFLEQSAGFLPSFLFLFLINGAAVFAAETAICPPPPSPSSLAAV